MAKFYHVKRDWPDNKNNFINCLCCSFIHTGCVSELGNFKNVMNWKCFHLFSFNTCEHKVYIKEFRFNLTHWKQKSYFLKITSFRWPPFHSRHSLSLLRTSPTTLWSISTGIRLTSSWIRCFNYWTVWGAGAFEDLRFQIPPEREITCWKIGWPGWPHDVHISGDTRVYQKVPRLDL